MGSLMRKIARLPPCGGSGLKSTRRPPNVTVVWSPSMRREWIEMILSCILSIRYIRLPPCGGSGLKCADGELTVTVTCLPPCGGSGLKFRYPHRITPQYSLPPCGGSGLKYLLLCVKYFCCYRSPSMRREWIEIRLALPMRLVVMSLPPCGGSGLKL